MQWQPGHGVLKMMLVEFAGALPVPICRSLENLSIYICRLPFDGCCPDCKMPGDDCPIGNTSVYNYYHIFDRNNEIIPVFLE